MQPQQNRDAHRQQDRLQWFLLLSLLLPLLVVFAGNLSIGDGRCIREWFLSPTLLLCRLKSAKLDGLCRSCALGSTRCSCCCACCTARGRTRGAAASHSGRLQREGRPMAHIAQPEARRCEQAQATTCARGMQIRSLNTHQMHSRVGLCPWGAPTHSGQCSSIIGATECATPSDCSLLVGIGAPVLCSTHQLTLARLSARHWPIVQHGARVERAQQLCRG